MPGLLPTSASRAVALAAALGAGPGAAQAPGAFAVLALPPAGAGACGPVRSAAPTLRFRSWRLVSADSSRARTITVNDDSRPGRLSTYSDHTTDVLARPGTPEEAVGVSFRSDVGVVGHRERRVTPAPPGAPGEFRRTPLTPDEVARVRALMAWMRTRCRA